MEGGDAGETPPIFTQSTATAPDDGTANSSLIDNLINNSDLDFSKDGYLNRIAVGGTDVPNEAYNFYRHRLIKVTDVEFLTTTSIRSVSNPFKSTYTYPMSFVIHGAGGTTGQTLSGTLTRGATDDLATLSTPSLASTVLTNATLWLGDTLNDISTAPTVSTASSVQALKADVDPPHSLWAGNESANPNIPRWGKLDGWAEMGSTTDERWSLDTPFALNEIRPGLTIHVICIISIRPAVPPTPMPLGCKLFFGVWDGTTTQNKWIEGNNFDLNAAAVGTTTAGTSVSYKAIATTSEGATLESDVAVVNPSNAALSTSNYNRLTWTNAPGILDFKLYRLMGGVYSRIFTITNGASDYNDTGGSEETLTAFPVTFNTKPIVYKETGTYYPIDGSWTAVTASIQVPSNYNTGLTTGKQWFRMGIVGPTITNRSVLIDRIGVSFLPGGWARSSRDKTLIAQNTPSSTPTNSTQGGSGITNCLDAFTLVRIKDGDASRWTPICEIDRGEWIWDGARKWNRITKIKEAKVDSVFLVVMDNGAWIKCTESERFITSRADKKGSKLENLTVGDTIISPSDKGVSLSEIVSIEQIHEPSTVYTLTLQGGQHVFAAGNYTDAGIKALLCHNLKQNPTYQLVE